MKKFVRKEKNAEQEKQVKQRFGAFRSYKKNRKAEKLR